MKMLHIGLRPLAVIEWLDDYLRDLTRREIFDMVMIMQFGCIWTPSSANAECRSRAALSHFALDPALPLTPCLSPLND